MLRAVGGRSVGSNRRWVHRGACMLAHEEITCGEKPSVAAGDRAHLGGLLACPTRYLFLTGKGGVGKTTVACAAALVLADHGKRVLLVSTDPASNLDEMLGVALSDRPRS